LFDSSGPARPCNSQNSFILARTLFLSGGEVFNEAEPCNIHAKTPAKIYIEKRPHRRSSTFDQYKVTARGSAGYPHVRHSVQKLPKGAAGLAQQVRKIEVFFKRLCAQVAQGCSRTSTTSAQNRRHITSVQKSLSKNYPRKDRLQAQPDRHNKRARSNAQVPYEHDRISEGTQPHHTNYSYIRAARAPHTTLVQLSG
jgi:hypothetical protein